MGSTEFWQGWVAAVEAAKARTQVLINEAPLTSIHSCDTLVTRNALLEVLSELTNMLDLRCDPNAKNSEKMKTK